MTDFQTLARQRYSERYFDNKPLEAEKLDQILDAGRLAPTACNKQPQRFYVLTSDEARQKAVEGSLSSTFGAPVAIIVCYDVPQTWHNVRETLFTDYHTGEQDCAISATTMMYAAEDLGVHSLYMRDFDARQLRAAFGLPDTIVPALVLLLGYPSERSHPARLHSQRNDMADFVTRL